MVRYLVKEKLRATNQNPSFAGQKATAFFGKECKMLAYLGEHAEAVHAKQELAAWMVEEYGYKRASDAKRNWIFKYAEDISGDHWHRSVEIVEVWIEQNTLRYE